MSNPKNAFDEVVYNSPWRNAYWFARMLLNTDQYGALGKKDALMSSLVSEIEAVIEQQLLTDEEKFKVCLNIIRNKIGNTARAGSKTANLYEDLLVALESELQTITDIVVFAVTIKYD